MRNPLALFGLLFFYHSLAWSDLTIRVLDQQGRPLANAVVAIAKRDFEFASTDSDGAAVMDQVDKQFQPHVLVVEQDQEVVFPNSDQVRHHVYSFSKPNDFEIKLYSGDQADPVRFEHPGIAVLGCNIHDQMVAYLYIAKDELAKVTDAEGKVRFEGELLSAPEATQVTLWHSRLSSSRPKLVSSQRKTGSKASAKAIT